MSSIAPPVIRDVICCSYAELASSDMSSDGYALIVLATYGVAGLALGTWTPRWGLAVLVAFVAVSSSLPWQLGLLNLAYPHAYVLGFLTGVAWHWAARPRILGSGPTSGTGSRHRRPGARANGFSDRATLLAVLAAAGICVSTGVSVARGVPLASAAFWSTAPQIAADLTIFDPQGIAGVLQAFLVSAVGVLVFVVGLKYLRHADSRAFLLRAFVLGTVVAALSPAVQALLLDPTVRPDKGTSESVGAVGFFQDPHSYAAFLVLGLAVATGLSIGLRNAGGRVRALGAGAVAGAALIALAFTNSRTGLIAGLEALVLVGSVAWLSRRRRSPAFEERRRDDTVVVKAERMIAGFAVGAIAVASVLLLLQVSTTARAAMSALAAQFDRSRVLETMRPGGTGQPLMARRLLLWRKASQIIVEQPLWGVGPQGFQEATVVLPTAEYDRYADLYGLSEFRYALEEMHVENAHNYYLQVAAEHGLPVLAAWLALVLYALWVVFRGALS